MRVQKIGPNIFGSSKAFCSSYDVYPTICGPEVRILPEMILNKKLKSINLSSADFTGRFFKWSAFAVGIEKDYNPWNFLSMNIIFQDVVQRRYFLYGIFRNLLIIQ